MARVGDNLDRLTVDMPADMRALLDRMAEDKGWSVAACVRRIIADHFAQLREGQS